MGAGASKPPIPANHPAGVAFRRKLEEIRRRRKVRASRDSIVSTTELLKDRTDLESVGDVARLSTVGLDALDSAEAKEAAGAAINDGKPGEDAKEELGAAVVNEEKKEEGKGEQLLAQIEEKKELVPGTEVVTKKVEIAETVTSLAAEVALLKIEEEGEDEEEEEEEEVKDGSELTAGDLPGSPSFRYFALINNQAGDSDSDDNQKAAGASNAKGDELEEEGQETKELVVKNGEDGSTKEKSSRKKKRRKMMVRLRARSLAKGPVAMCTFLNVNACYSAPHGSPNSRSRTSIRHIFLDQSKDKVTSSHVEDRPSTSESATAADKSLSEEVTPATIEKLPATATVVSNSTVPVTVAS